MQNGVMRLSLVLFLLSGCALSSVIRLGPMAVRTIKVCILNDKESPSSEKIIKDTTDAVFTEYEKNVGVRFVINTFAVFDGDLESWSIELGPMVKSFCRPDDEARMIFTNKELVVIREGQEAEVGGFGHEYYGFVIIFNVGGRYLLTDLAGNPALETSLKHEIGHLFGLNHTIDRESFMFTPSNKSYGRWTDEVIRLLKKNKQQKWY